MHDPEAGQTLKIACPSCRQKLDMTELAPFTRVACPRCGGAVIAPKPFGNFMLEEILGRRAGVVVYRALDLALDREVVVKVLEQQAEAHGERFLELARRAAAVNHIGTVPMYSCGRENGQPFLVAQFMDGGPLSLRLSRLAAVRDDDLRLALDWGHAVAGGLMAAHAQGLTHGAVCPRTIFLDGDGHAKIGDFGLAALLRDCSAADEPVHGYWSHLAPECLAGAPAGCAADVYGLGSVLYRALTGSDCRGKTDGPQARDGGGPRPPSPRDLNPAVPADVSELCMHMLHPDPALRLTDLEEAQRVFNSAARTRVAAAVAAERKNNKGVRVEAPLARRIANSRWQHLSRQRAPRHGWVNILLGLACLVLLLLALAYGLHSLGFDLRRPGRGVAAPAEALGDPLPSVETHGPHDGVDGSLPNQDAAALPSPPVAADGTADGLARHAAARPRPADLDFGSVAATLTRYLRSLPPDLLAIERERLDHIVGTRDALISLMRYLPYNGGQEADILLQGGKRVQAAVPYCNDRQVALRRGEGQPLQHCAWGDLAFEQYVRFMEFYLDQRGEHQDGANAAAARRQTREIAEECLRLALLCEWYGRTELASRYAARALRTDPAIQAKLQRLLPAPS